MTVQAYSVRVDGQEVNHCISETVAEFFAAAARAEQPQARVEIVALPPLTEEECHNLEVEFFDRAW